MFQKAVLFQRHLGVVGRSGNRCFCCKAGRRYANYCVPVAFRNGRKGGLELTGKKVLFYTQTRLSPRVSQLSYLLYCCREPIVRIDHVSPENEWGSIASVAYLFMRPVPSLFRSSRKSNYSKTHTP